MNSNLAQVIVMGMLFSMVLLAFVTFLIIRRRPAKRTEGEFEALSLRLQRIEQGVDTIAVEVERVSEGQRFTTRLLSDRSNAAPALSPKQITPH